MANKTDKLQQIHDHPHRRRYDNTQVYNSRSAYEKKRRIQYKKHKEGFLSHLWHYLGKKEAFHEKYKGKSPVHVSFSRLLITGNPFAPARSVYRYVDQEVAPRQLDLRPIFTQLYQWGWCDVQGKRLLQPVEFNLISDSQRLMDENYIEEFLLNPYHPTQTLENLNFFLAYYFSVAYDPTNLKLLRNAIEKMLPVIASQRPDQIESEKIPHILGQIDAFFTPEIEKRFIIPLFECYYGRPLTRIRNYIQPVRVSQEEYYADAKLKKQMEALELHYIESIRRKKEDLAFSLELFEMIEQDLPKSAASFTTGTSSGESLLDYGVATWLLASRHEGFNEPPLTHQRCYLALQYFLHTYAPVLNETLELRPNLSDPARTLVPFFQEEPFAHELSALRENIMTSYHAAREEKNKDLMTTEPEKLFEEQKTKAAIFNTICDRFYSIGVKLAKYALRKQGQSNTSYPIGSADLGRYRSKYESHIIYGFPESKKGSSTSHLFLRSVDNVLEEIRAFCFQGCYYLESQQRSFDNDSPKTAPLAVELQNRKALQNRLNEVNLELEKSPGKKSTPPRALE